MLPVALAPLAAARKATTSKPAPATRGAPGHGRSDAIEAAALAAALVAESALESGSVAHKAGPWGPFTPSHLYDFDGLYDPDCGSDDDFDNPHGDWLDFG
jgi:hypothetical protein